MCMTFSLTSSAFSEGEHIPKKYACDGDNVSPPLTFSGVPEETKSLALIMEDPDIPKELYPNGGTFDHWVVFNMPAGTAEVAEGTTPPGTGGVNSTGKIKSATLALVRLHNTNQKSIGISFIYMHSIQNSHSTKAPQKMMSLPRVLGTFWQLPSLWVDTPEHSAGIAFYVV